LRISLVVNLHRPDAIEAAQWAARWLFEHGVYVRAEGRAAVRLELESSTDPEVADSDLVMAFGGDGTLIRAAHMCSERGTPIMGVHFGRFGFVTQCDPDEIALALRAFLEKEHRVEKRMMIETNLIRGERTVATVHSLNESVLQRTVTDRMLTFDVEVNRQLLTSYPADGVMVSTPTGSTGYNLSAGGPVVDPQVEAMVLVAIAPHTLSARPLVLSADSHVTLRLDAGGDAVLSADGQARLHLLPGDQVEICRSERTTNLVTIQNEDFLHKLRNRLFWSQSIVGKESERRNSS
jgi:NAD+ kinase